MKQIPFLWGHQILRILCALSLLAIVGCQDTERINDPQGPIQVLLPWVHQERSQLSPVLIESLQEVRQARGQAAQFFLTPGVENNELVGLSPRIRVLRTQGGVFVPQDVLSSKVLALYAHIERLMFFDRALGVDTLNRWPRKVGINTVLSGGSQGGSGRIVDQAVYSGQLDAMLFTVYEGEKLPLAFNPGVIAHEHFHSLFFHKVLQPLGGHYVQSVQSGRSEGTHSLRFISAGLSTEQIYELVLLRAINEGLADVWGWLYSGDSDFVFRSLPQVQTRQLTEQPNALLSQKTLRSLVQRQRRNPQYLEALAYQEGEKLAKLLVRSFTIYGRETAKQRETLAQIVLDSLSEISAWGVQKTMVDRDLTHLLASKSEKIQGLSPQVCARLKADAEEFATLSKEECL